MARCNLKFTDWKIADITTLVNPSDRFHIISLESSGTPFNSRKKPIPIWKIFGETVSAKSRQEGP